jgi:uncharacterized protein
MSEGRKVGFVVTHGADDPELATIPFMLATGAMTMNVDPVIILQGEAVKLAVEGYASKVTAEGMQPLEDLLVTVLEGGHRIMLCSPCMLKRGIGEDELREGFFVGGAAMVVAAMLECENMLRY